MISYTGERESLETVQKLAGAVKAGLGTEPVEKIGREADLHKEE